jgi:hypothetical protein
MASFTLTSFRTTSLCFARIVSRRRSVSPSLSV